MSDDYRQQLNQVAWSLCILSICTVSARCYCRAWVLRRFGWDDGFMVLALALGICMAVLVSIGVKYGYGLHLEDITNPIERELALKFTYISPAPSILASTAGKISMILFLLRLLGHTAQRGHRWFLFGAAAVMVVLNVFTIGIIVGQCSPVEKSWKPWVPGKCLNAHWLDIGGRIQAVWNAFVDLVTALFPVYMVWSMQMKTSTKWGLTFLMGGGVFAAAATFVKVYYMRDMTKLTDVTYAWGPLALWYMAEVFVLIIMGSVPTLKPLLSQIQGQLPSMDRYAFSSKKQSTDSGKITTVGSKSLNGNQRRGHGEVTLALEDIDNMTRVSRQPAGSSTESILATTKDEGTVTTSQAMDSPPPSPKMQPVETQTTTISRLSSCHRDRSPRESSTDRAIRVKQDFQIGYSERSKEDTIAYELSKRP